MKRYLALTLALILTISLLCGCGAKHAANDMGSSVGRTEIADGEVLQEETLASAAGSAPDTTLPESRKLVRKLWLNAETEELDPLLTQINDRISQLEGYIEEREVYNGSQKGNYSYRYANITVRIPVESMDEFVAQVDENTNVTSTNETTDNITLTYVATESRMKALETEQARLLELLAQAENMDDLLQIESRLTDVRTELEKVTSQLRIYDNMVDYGTIYLRLTEVKEYTVVDEPDSVWERMGRGFMTSLKALGNFFVELFVAFVVALPWLIPLGIIVTLIILAARHRKKKRRNDPPHQPGA